MQYRLDPRNVATHLTHPGSILELPARALKAQIERDQARARHYFTAAVANHDYSLPLASAPLGRETASSDSSSAGTSADANDG